jgi:aminopeptidase N
LTFRPSALLSRVARPPATNSRVARALGLAALLICLIPTAAEARDCVAGAPGIGDSYYPGYGNGGYDVRHYDLDVTYDPATDRLDGRASIRARSRQRLCSFNLDLVGLEVRRVKVDGMGAAWSRDGQELVVTPRRPLKKRAGSKIVVRYGGVPVALRAPDIPVPTAFMTTSDGAIIAGQPEVAATWYPVNDHPRDKASYSFEVTVPDGFEVVANGKPRGQDQRPGALTAWRWEAREPMASYLATIDIGHWDVVRWRTDDGVPVYDAVDTAITGGLRAEIDSSLARQGEILGLLSDAFGPYPFSTVGGIVDNERPLGFALETQTRPVYSWLFWLDQGRPANGDYVVVHELAHQWFGDDVALDRWQDIWLNEGFATYAEWLWLEHEGQLTPQQSFQAAYNAFPADDPFWSVAIGDPGPERLFDLAVYVRGAMTLHALRNAVGDRAFWKIVRRWSSRKSRKAVTTEAFVALAERVSGQQLEELFETWLFTPQKPILPASSRSGAPQPKTERTQDRVDAWLEAVQTRLRHGRY